MSLSEYKEDDSIPSYRLRSDNYNSKEERPQYSTFSVKESFTQSLQEQLGYRNLTEHQYAVASFIIGSLDDDGYLRRSIDSIVDDLSFRANIETDEEEVMQMLKIVQEFDPAGVGARVCRSICAAAAIDHGESFSPKQNNRLTACTFHFDHAAEHSLCCGKKHTYTNHRYSDK